MAVAVPFGPYAPDIASVDASVCGLATNVVPRADGYGPVPLPGAISLALPGPCRGAIELSSTSYDFPIYVAGTATGLYCYDPVGKGWKDVTNAGTPYSVPPGEYWCFAQYGTLLLACSAGTPVQKVEIDQVQAGRKFENLGGSPPRARHMAVVGEFLVLAGIPGMPNSVRWSDLGDIEQWGLGLDNHEADEQIFPDGGAVTGFAGGEFGVVFQARAIRRMVFSPGSDEIFDFSVLEQERGAVSPWSIVKAGPQIFFLDRDGFYALVVGGGVSTPIGAERVDRFFAGRVDPDRIGQTLAFRDITGTRILFAYRLAGADVADATLLGEALCYDWQLDRWSFLALPIRAGLTAATPSVSIDSIEGSADDPAQPSFDDPGYAGGTPRLGVITPDNRLALLQSGSMEATIATPDAMIFRGSRGFVRGVRLDGDAADWRVQVGVRESLAVDAPVRLLPETGPTVERFAPCRASGRYHRAQVRIPQNTPWTYARAIEPDAVPEGTR